MDPISIAALVAMIAGAGMQYKASTDAAKRAQDEALRGMMRQDEYQRQAEKKALGQAQEFNTDDRAAEQAQIEQQLTQEYIAPAKSATEINSSATTTQGAVSNDYTTAKARSQAEVLKNAESLARLLGKTGAANKLRSNEALRMSDTAAGIDRLGNFSRGMGAVDQYATQQAGRPDAGLMLAGGVLSAAGGYGLASGAGAASTGASASAPAGTLGSGTTAPITTGIGSGTAGLGTGMWGMQQGTYKVPSIMRYN